MEIEVRRALALDIAWKLYGVPYIWGGDDPIVGFDCSGLIVEILKSVGVLPLNGDWTAHDLWEYFKESKVDAPYFGCLVFWEAPNSRARHVEMILNDELSIGASGGRSTTTNLATASKQNAYVKIRPFEGRGRIKGFLDPFRIN